MSTSIVPPSGPFLSYRAEIQLRALAGGPPPLSSDPARLEAQLAAVLPPEVLGYLHGGAGGGATMRANRSAFDRWALLPRLLCEIAERDWATTVVGTPMPAPVLLAPVGAQTIFHPEGEVASARGAAAVGLPVVLSTVSSYSIEEVAAAAGDTPRWFQLYRPEDDAITRSLLERAEAAGYSALVVTVDNRIAGWRTDELDSASMRGDHGQGVLETDPVFRARLAVPPERDPVAAAAFRATQYPGPPPTPQRLAELRQWWSGPILVKGVLHPAEARAVVDAGLDGIVVSNHGGRQLDRGIGALEALPGVIEAVAGRAAVLMDSGIRSGADAALALALGADAVLVGRPFVYGLALAGAEGVEHVLRCVLAELDASLALSGFTDLAGLRAAAEVVVRRE